MDDNGNILYYLVLGAIYVLSRVFGKKKKPAPQPKGKRQVAPPTAEKEGPPPISFEDILRELSGTPKPKPEPVNEPVSEPIIGTPDYAAEETPVYREGDSSPYGVDEIDEIAVDYQVPKGYGEELYKADYSRESQSKQSFTRAEFFKIEEKETVDYLEVLKLDNGPAKAFVMSEIFQRKF